MEKCPCEWSSFSYLNFSSFSSISSHLPFPIAPGSMWEKRKLYRTICSPFIYVIIMANCAYISYLLPLIPFQAYPKPGYREYRTLVGIYTRHTVSSHAYEHHIDKSDTAYTHRFISHRCSSSCSPVHSWFESQNPQKLFQLIEFSVASCIDWNANAKLAAYSVSSFAIIILLLLG